MIDAVSSADSKFISTIAILAPHEARAKQVDLPIPILLIKYQKYV